MSLKVFFLAPLQLLIESINTILFENLPYSKAIICICTVPVDFLRSVQMRKKGTLMNRLDFFHWFSQDPGYHVWWQHDADYMNSFRDRLTKKEVTTNM